MATPGTDEELKFYLRFAKPLALNLKDPSDRATASAWIQKLKNEEFGALKSRTDHLKLLLFALQKERLVGRFSENPASIEKLEDFSEEIKLQDIARQLLEAEVTERRKQAQLHPPYYVEYSPDLKEYAASQKIPNFGIQGYYAFSKEPIFLWYKSEKVVLPKDVMELDGDALHGIHLPLSGAEISRPRLPRSPDKSKPKTILSLEKSIAELEGKSGTSVTEEAVVPVIPIGSPHSPEDREPPSWGSNLGTVSEPPEKEISPKASPKSPAVGGIEGDILEDEHPPSFLDISSISLEKPSPGTCPFLPTPRVPSPRRQSPCPLLRPTSPSKYPQFGEEGDLIDEEMPPELLDLSPVASGEILSPPKSTKTTRTPVVQQPSSFEQKPSQTPKRKPPRGFPADRKRVRLPSSEKEKRQEELKKVRRRLDWSENQCRLGDIEGDLLEQSQPQLASSFIDEIPLSPLTQQRLQGELCIDEVAGDILDDELPDNLLDSGEMLSPPKSAKTTRTPTVQQPSSSEQPCLSMITPTGARRPPAVRPEKQYRGQPYSAQTPKLPKEERRKKFAMASKKLDFSPYADEGPVVQETTTETIMKDGVSQKTTTTVKTVKTPDQRELEDIEGDELLPGDLDTSVMRELERELAEAAVQEVEMLEDEYEGMDKYAEMERELNEMDANMAHWDALLKELEEEHKEDILAVEREEEEERKKAGKKKQKKTKQPSQLPSPSAPSSHSPRQTSPSPRLSSPRQPSPSFRLFSPCQPSPSPHLPSPRQRSPSPRLPSSRLPSPRSPSPRSPSPRPLDYGPCPTEQRIREIAEEADDYLTLDMGLPDFVSTSVDDVELSPKRLPVGSPAALPATSQFMDGSVLDQTAPEFAPSFIDELPLSPRDVVQAVTRKVITKDGVPQKEITTTTTIPKRIPKRQIPRPGGVITKVKKQVVSKNGVPQQEIVTTETIPQPSTSGISIPSKIATSKIPGRPSSRIPSSGAAKATLQKPSETPKRRPPRGLAPGRSRVRLSSSEKEKRQEELKKVRRRLDWSENQCRLGDIEGDLLEQSQPQLASSFIDEIPLSPITLQRLQGVATTDEGPIVQKTTTETIIKDGVPQKTITTVETLKQQQQGIDDVAGDILDDELPDNLLDSGEMLSPPKSTKTTRTPTVQQPSSSEQPCLSMITPTGARRPPTVRPEKQYRGQPYSAQTPKLPKEERRKKFAMASKKLDFSPYADEGPVVQETTTETIMKDGVPQKTTTTVKTVKTPEDQRELEDIEGDELLSGDLDTSVMRELERELAEAAVQEVEMLEDEYEGMDKYAEMERELNEMDANMAHWDALLKELEEEHKEDILAVEREEEEERKKAGKKTKQPSPLTSPSSHSPRQTSPSLRLSSPSEGLCRLEDIGGDVLDESQLQLASSFVDEISLSPKQLSPQQPCPSTITPQGAKRPPIVKRETRKHTKRPIAGHTPTLSDEERRRRFAGAARRIEFGLSPVCGDIHPDDLNTSAMRELQRELEEVTALDGRMLGDEFERMDNYAEMERELNEVENTMRGWDALLNQLEEEHKEDVCATEAPIRAHTVVSPEYASRTPRTRYSDRTQARERVKRRIDMGQAPPQQSPRSRQDVPPPCESVPQVQSLTKEQQRRLMLGDEYNKYEEYKKRRRADVPATPPMFSRFKIIRDEAEGTVYEPEQFGVSADEVWQEGAEALKDLALVRSPTGAGAKFFEDETPPDLVNQEEEYAKDEAEKRDLNRRLGKVMDDIQRIKNEIAESAGLPVTFPKKSPSPRRPRISSDFLTSESPPRFDELLLDEEQISPLEDDRQHRALQNLIAQEEYPGLLDESPPPLSPGELPQISEEIYMRSPPQLRRSPSPPISMSPRAICGEVPQLTSPATRATSPKPICPVKTSPTEDIDLRELRRNIRERAERPTDVPHVDVMLGKTSGKRRRIPRKSPAVVGAFIEREEEYTPPERVPGWQTPPHLKAKPALPQPQRTREVWDVSHAPPRPVRDAELDDERPPEELFTQIVDDYVDGVPVKRTETKVTTSLPHKPSTTSPKPVSPKIAIRDKPLQPVEGPGIDDEQLPEELFTEIVDEYVDGVPVKRTETKVTTAVPQKEPVCQFQPRSPTTIARDEPIALLDESPPRLFDDEELDRRVDAQEDQCLQNIVCRSPISDILDEQEIDLVPTSPTSTRPTTTRSPIHELPASVPSTSTQTKTPPRFYRVSKEGTKVMDEVRRGATPFKDMQFQWDVICGKTRGGKPTPVKRYGRYRRTYVPGLGRVEEHPFCGDGLLEKYAELPGPSQPHLPEDLMGHEVPIISSPISERSHIMDEDVPLGLQSPIGQPRLPGWKTPPHLQYERMKRPKKRVSSQQRSPRPGPSTSPVYTKRKQTFVDGSPVRTVETRVSTPPRGLHDVSDIEFVESPPPPDESIQPQLQAIVEREHFGNLVAQSPPQFEDISSEEDLSTEIEDHGQILQGILSKDVCPGLLGESPPPFSPDQPSSEEVEYDVGGRSPIRIRRRLFPPTSPSSPGSRLVSASVPGTAADSPPAQSSTRIASPHRIPVCPITSPTSPEIDTRRLRREIQERAVRPTDVRHVDVMLGKTSGKRRRIPRKSPAVDGAFIEREEEYTPPERVPGWQTPPHLKAKPTLPQPQRTREVWDVSHAPPRPVRDAELDDERPPEELFTQIVDDYVDGVPVKRTETKVTTSLPHKPSTTSPKPVSPKIAIRDKPLQPVEGPGIDDEQLPEELFTEIVDEYVDGVPVKRTETKVTTAVPQKEPVCQFQPRSPTTIARDEPIALLDESPPRLFDDEELDRRVDAQEDQCLQNIVCRSPISDILDEQEIDLVPTSPTSTRPTTTRSPIHELPASVPSTSRQTETPPRFYRVSKEGTKVMDEVRRGATPFKDMQFQWDVICGKTRGGKPTPVKRYGRYRRTYVPGLGRVEEHPFCGDGLLEKYAELPGPSQPHLPEDLMGHEVPIISSPVSERSHIMDEDVPLGLHSPIGQPRLPGWKTPPHLQYERMKRPKKRVYPQPRPGPSTSPGYTKRKQTFVDGSPVRTVETRVSTPPRGLHDVSDIEFVESPPPPDESIQPQLQAIVEREHFGNLEAQSPPQFEIISSEEDLSAEIEDHGQILQGILTKNVCPGLLGESPPPFSPDQPSPEEVEYDVGGRSPVRIRRRLFPADSPPSPTPAPTVTPSRYISPVCSPSREIDPRQLRREVRERAVRPPDRGHVDVLLGKTSGRRRRVHKRSHGPESRFIEREEDDVVDEAGVPGWSTPPRLARENLQPLKVPKFDLWSDYGERRQKSAKPPVVTEVSKKKFVRKVEKTITHTPECIPRICEESPPPLIRTPPQRSPPEFRSMTQQAQHYSPLSEMSPPAFVASTPRRSPRQISLPSVYQDAAGVLDTSQPELVCSPTDTRVRSPRQISLPIVHQNVGSVLDTSHPELVCSSPPQQRIKTPRSPRQVPLSIQSEGTQDIEHTCLPQVVCSPQQEQVHIRSLTKSSSSREVTRPAPTHRMSRGSPIVMPTWPDPGTPTRSEYDTDIAFGGRASPGILDTSPISDIESDEECDFTWMG